MNALPLKKALQRVACGVVITFFVVLLTLIFSFLGTIICAALAGMMLGAAKPARWLVGLASLLFPSVIFGVLRTTGADLPWQKVLLLAGMCLGTFWLIYLVVSMMIFYEGKAGAAGGHGAKRSASALRRNGRLSLEALQGKWRLEPSLIARVESRKVLEIQKENLLLRMHGPTGELRFHARVTLTTGNTLPVLAIESQPESCADTHVSI